MGCNNTKAIPIIDDEDHLENSVVNPSAIVESAKKTEERTEAITNSAKVSDVTIGKTEFHKSNPAKVDSDSGEKGENDRNISPIESTTKIETDDEFLERMEVENQAKFTAAVEEWRKDKKAGKGEAKIVEVGGAFVKIGESREDGTKEIQKSEDKDSNDFEKEAKESANEDLEQEAKDDEGLGIGPFVAIAVEEGILPKGAVWWNKYMILKRIKVYKAGTTT